MLVSGDNNDFVKLRPFDPAKWREYSAAIVARTRPQRLSQPSTPIMVKRPEQPEKPIYTLPEDIAAIHPDGTVTYWSYYGPPNRLLSSPVGSAKIRAIIRLVAYEHNLTPADILSPVRTKNFVVPRQIAIWLARKVTSASLPKIGRHFGGRDHTTILHAERKINAMIRVDAVLADKLSALRARLGGAS